ncbi:response regulator [Pigmentibacter ruber]|uniref:response regulator n=1 Tax=Pigmentibacter ruber TaxID=2683196 RepID=UPI00131E41AB|nr:response regulator [Pigmentibacter ruber]
MYNSDIVFEENRYGKLNVLLVDDQSMVANSLATALLHNGFNVKVTDKIDEMKKIVNLEKVDVVIMEYAYKNGQGIEEIKNTKLKSKNAKIKFIVTSNDSRHEIKDNALNHQCDLFILKPFSIQDLSAEIKKIAKLEYRKSERVKCYIPFNVLKSANNYDTFATDISVDGTHLLDNDKIISPKIGEEIELKFTIPKILEEVKCKALVVRLSNNGFGLQFKDLDQITKNKIKLHIIQ